MLREGMNSPWGSIQQVFEIAEGIQQVSTAGHGGWKVYHKYNRLIPKEIRRKEGWYEEDCEVYIPAYYLYNIKGVGDSLGRSQEFFRIRMNTWFDQCS